MWTVLLIILLVIGLIIIGFLLYQKWEQVKLLDPTLLKDTSEKRMKYNILRQRLERTAGGYATKAIESVFLPFGKIVQDTVRRLVGKLIAAERSYQKKQKLTSANKLNTQDISRLLQEAKQFLNDEVYDRAEKTLIEIISSDAKNIVAYELLGRLYFAKKEYDLAKETFVFLKKLSPDDPSVIASLGEVEERLGNKDKANGYFQYAVKLSPNNPKYIDFAIKSFIEIGDVHEATLMLHRLRTVNSQNKKIDEFERQISEILKKRQKIK